MKAKRKQNQSCREMFAIAKTEMEKLTKEPSLSKRTHIPVPNKSLHCSLKYSLIKSRLKNATDENYSKV